MKAKRPGRWRSLAARLTRAYAIAALLGLATMAIAAAIIVDHSYFRTLQSGLADQARFAAVALRPALAAPAAPWTPGALEAQVDGIATGLATRLTVIAPDGMVLGDSWEDGAKMDNHLDRPEVVTALRGEIGINRRHSTTVGRRLFYLAIPVTDQAGKVTAIVRVAKVEEEVSAAVSQLLWAVALTALAATAFTLGVSAIVTARVTRPLAAMRQAAERMAAGNLATRVYCATDDEVGQMGASLNVLAEQLSRRLGEIEQARDQARALLTNMTSGVVLVSDSGELVMSNPQAQQWLALDRDLIGRPYTAVIRHAALLEAIGRVRAKGQSVRLELQPMPGDDRVLDVSVTPVAGGRGGIVVVLNDMSDARRMARLRSEFVANLSHQFKTPVAVIKGYAETLLDGALNDPDTAREFLKITKDEADRLAWLVSQVLELARLEDPQLLLQRHPADLRDIVRAAAERFRTIAAERGLVLNTGMPDASASVDCDRNRIEEAVGNLIDNAIKHSPPGGAIRVTLRDEAGAWRIAVADEGQGIPADALPRIFERFYRGPGATAGTGLGLAIVKHVAEVHGGRAWARNRRDGRGAEVGFDLPRA